MVPEGFFDPQYFTIIGVFRRQEKGDVAFLQMGRRPRRNLTQCAPKLSRPATEFPQMEQAECNPYVVGPQGAAMAAVDAAMRL